LPASLGGNSAAPLSERLPQPPSVTATAQIPIANRQNSEVLIGPTSYSTNGSPASFDRWSNAGTAVMFEIRGALLLPMIFDRFDSLRQKYLLY
jgi:hypothetical protein